MTHINRKAMALAAAAIQMGILLVFLVAGAKLNAQCLPSCFDNTSVTVPTVGTTPAGSYAISQIETIDTTTGNVSLRIPITKLPPGRGGMTEGLNLIYNSQVYDVNIQFQSSADPNSGGLLVPWHRLTPGVGVGGWHYEWAHNYSLGVEVLPSTPDLCNQSVSGYIYRTVLYFPDGSRHPLRIAGYGNFQYGYYQVAPGQQPVCPGGPTPPTSYTLYTTDSTYIAIQLNATTGSPTPWSWAIYFPDGRQGAGFGTQLVSILDQHANNAINFNSSSSGNTATTSETDALGRTIQLTYNLSSSTLPYSDTVVQTGAGGQPLQWTVNWETIPSGFFAYPATNYGVCSYTPPTSQGDCGFANFGLTSVASLILPPGDDGANLSYQFGYNTPGWGELNSMTLPTGATVSYTYAGFATQFPLISFLYLDPIVSKTVSGPFVNPSETSHYSFTSTSSQFTNPDGGIVNHSFFDVSGPNFPSGLTYSTKTPDGSTIERYWNRNTPVGCGGPEACNPYVQYEYRSVASGGTPVQASVTQHTYDQNGNEIVLSESGWVPYSNIAHGSSCGLATGAPCPLNPSVTRSTARCYNFPTNPASTPPPYYANVCPAPANSANAYWQVGGVFRKIDTMTRSQISSVVNNVATTGSIDEYDYSASFRVTQERHWDLSLGAASQPLTSSNADVLSYTYDSYGHVLSATDAMSVTTNFTYDSTNNLCLTGKVVAASTPNARSFTFACDFSSGLTTGESDSDHNIGHGFTYDKFGRLTQDQTNGAGTIRYKKATYLDGSNQIQEQSDVFSANDGVSIRSTWFDSLGRVRQTSDSFNNTSQTMYYTSPSALCGVTGGYSYRAVSNPTNNQGETSTGWTRTTMDRNGRVIEVQSFAGTSLPCPWVSSNTIGTGKTTTSYSSNSVTVTDEAGVSRTSYIDGMGRLDHIVETGIGATTSYIYDTLDDLIGVIPPQGNQRGFAYNSLRRLTSATIPETGTSPSTSGTTTYTYDRNGNLLTRAAGGLTSTYAYNQLNDLTSKTYTNDPQVVIAYNKGWRTSVSVGGIVTYAYTTYDGLGRVTAASQSTGGQQYPFSYSYNLLDEVTSMTLPSGRVVATGYDNMGRPLNVTGTMASVTKTYVSGVSYAPHGAPQQMTLGNGLLEQTCFNSRLQPFVIRQRTGAALSCATATSADSSDVGYFAYTFSSTNNNGNVLGQTIQYGTTPTFATAKTFQQNYTYDGVNRLSGMTETGPGASWSQSYDYDLVGNRWLSGGTQIDPLTPQGNGYDALNHMSGAQYTDGRGNQTQIGGYTYQYDAENRLIASTLAQNGTVYASATYSYDGDGRRVLKQSNGETTHYVYDVQGNLAAEYTLSGTPAISGTSYLMPDHLGSTRMVTDSGGGQKVLYDYAPFGEELTTQAGRDVRWGGPGNGMHFTGQAQEGAEGDYMHYFGARFYSAGQGRFTGADEPLADQHPANPQSWNLYSYVRNNPLRFTDPTGRECVTLDTGGVGDNGVGNACADKSLLTTHGVTVYGNTGDSTSSIFGNAALMGDINLSGAKDRINGQTTEFSVNLLPFAKGGGLGFAAVLGQAGAENVAARMALALGGRVVGGNAEKTVVQLAGGALVTFGAKKVGSNLTVNISGFAFGKLLALRGLLAAARAEGAETVTIVAEDVLARGFPESLAEHGFAKVGPRTFARTFDLK